MNKIMKRTLSLIMTVVMLVSLVPVQAFASVAGIGPLGVNPQADTVDYQITNKPASGQLVAGVPYTPTAAFTSGEELASQYFEPSINDGNLITVDGSTFTALDAMIGQTLTITAHGWIKDSGTEYIASVTLTVVAAEDDAEAAAITVKFVDEDGKAVEGLTDITAEISVDDIAEGTKSIDLPALPDGIKEFKADGYTIADGKLTVTWAESADIPAEITVTCVKAEEEDPNAEAPENGDANYTGDLVDDVVVEVGNIAIIVKQVNDEGASLADPVIVQVPKSDASAVVSVRAPAAGETTAPSVTADGKLSVSWNADDEDLNQVQITVVYTPAEVTYTVRHEYAAVDASSAPEVETVTLTGKVGKLTEAAPKQKDGFAAQDFDQKLIAYQGDNDITIKYDRDRCTLTYNSQGGSYVEPQSGVYGQTVTVFTAASQERILTCTKEEHSHIPATGNAAAGNVGEISGCYICAQHWFFGTYYTWDLNCSKELHAHSNDCYTTVGGESEPTPTRQGYTFGGWYLDADFTTAALATMELTGNTTVYAKWTANTANYTIVYFKEVWDNSTSTGYSRFDSSVVKSGTVGDTVTGSNDQTFAHYTFDHADSNVIMPDGSTVIGVYYKLTRYTMVFNLNKNGAAIQVAGGGRYTGSGYTLQNVVLGMNLAGKWPSLDAGAGPQIIEPTSGNNRYFDKWGGSYASLRFEVTADMLKGNGDNQTVSGTTVTYTASWRSKDGTINVEYWLQDPNNPNLYVKSNTYSQEKVPADSLSAKDIYGFTKVSSTPSGYTGSDTDSSPKVYRFYYKRNSQTLTFFYKSEQLKSETILFGADIKGKNYTPARPADVDSEATFVGWFDNAGCEGDPYVFTTMPGNNVSLYAKWKPVDKTVTLVYDNGTENTSITVPKGSSVSGIPTPEKAGYDFAGWYTAAEGGTLFNPDAPLNDNITIYAHWTEKTTTEYTVRYLYADDNSEAAPPVTLTGTIGRTVYADALDIKGDDGESLAVNALRQSFVLTKNADENVITFLYNRTSERSYTVVYKYGDTVLATGESGKTKSNNVLVNADGDIIAKLNGKGYVLDENASKNVNLTAADTEIVFKLIPAVFKIKYACKSTEGEPITGIDASAGNPAEFTIDNVNGMVIKAPGLSGDAADTWVFDHWEFSATNSLQKNVVAQNVTLLDGTVGSFTATAVFRPKVYKVTYDLNGGTSTDGLPLQYTRLKYGTATPTIDDPERTGYTFTGWAPEVSQTVKGNATYVAQWDKNSYDLTINYVDASGNVLHTPYTDTLEYEAAYSVDSPTIPGYTTTQTVVSGKMPADHVTVDVVYTEKADVTITYTTDGHGTATPTSESVKPATGNPTGSVAVPAAGYKFVKWVCGTADVCTNATLTKADIDRFAKDSDGLYVATTFTAIFEQDIAPYVVHHYLLGTEIRVANDTNGTATIGQSITPAAATDLLIPGAVVNSGLVPHVIAISGNEFVVYYTVPLTLKAADAEKVYDGTPLTSSDFTATGLVNGDSKDAISVTMTAASTITNVGTQPNVIDQNKTTGIPGYYTVSYENGTLEVKANSSVVVTITENSGTATYNGQTQSVTGYTVTSIKIGDEATALYTENDFTFTGTDKNKTAAGIDAGTYQMGLTADMFENTNANFENVTFVIVDGTLEISKRTVTLTSATDEKEYDGTALTNDEITVGGDGFASGEGATYTVTGTQTLVGSSENAFTYALNAGTKADNYEITTANGTLTVKDRSEKYEITVVANSAEAKYDGTAKTASGLQTTTFTVDGKTYTVEGLSASVTETDAGTYSNAITGTAVVKDAAGNDVTAQFTVNKTDGELVISKRTVTLTSATDEKEYDGTALTNDEITVGGDGFASGEGATYDVTGTQTLVGSSENAFTYALNAGTKADNYEITTANGTLTVKDRSEKYEITVVANSAEAKYDGTAKTASGLQTTTFTVDGKTYTVEGLSASVTETDAGTYTNAITGTAVVKDAAGNDVTAQFTVNKTDGTLEISKRTVTLTSATDEKEYDGTALTNDEITVGGDGFASGEGATYDVTGTQTLVGSSENTFTYALNADTNADNYTITTANGTLTVTDRSEKYEITVVANSGEAKYDGTEKTASGLQTTTFTVDGKTYTVEGLTATVSATDAGTYTNAITGTAVVKDAAGNDVTAQFTVNKTNGTLEISKRTVTLTSATDEKEYDGTALTNDEITVGGDGFASGEGAAYTVTGTQTLVGSSENAFTYELNEGTKADNYTITTANGTLTVTDRSEKYEITVVANSAEAKYDGTEKTASGLQTTTFTVDGKTYTVEGLSASVTETDAGTYTNAITGTAVVKDAAGNDVTAQFTVNKTDGTLEISKRTVTLTSATDEKEYDGTALTNDEITVTGDGFVTGEGATYTVTGTQTLVGSSENAFTYELNEGTKADNYTITTAYGTLTVKDRTKKYEITVVANSAEAKYDGTEKTASGLQTITFTVDGNTYTVEGLSATVSATDAGTYTNAITGTAVVKDAAGNDVTAQFTVNKTDGKLEISKRTVTLTSATDEKEYDGNPLTNSNVTVGGDGFASGEGAAYDVTGTQTLVGSSENTFTYKLNQGTKADNYTITTAYGTLTVKDRTKKYEITVVANSADAKYDGTEKTASGLQTTTFTVDGNTYTVEGLTATVSATDAGTYTNAITGTAVVKDAAGNDVTAQFTVNKTDGTLVISKRTVTLTSATDEKEYDGKPLTNSDVTVTGDGFASGEGAAYDVTGTQTLVGSSENTFTYKLNDGTKAGNYEITTENGTLTVKDRTKKYEITVVANSGEAKYDGTEKTASGLQTTTFTVDGNTYKVEGLSASVTETNAGTYTNAITGTAVVKDAAGNDVTAQFTVNQTPGKLVISKRTVTLTSATDAKEYDGKPLTNSNVTVGGDGFASGEGATYTVTGTQTLVGSSKNTFTYALNAGTKADNYTITTANGTLTVTDRSEKFAIELNANSDEVDYNGEIHSVSGVETNQFTFDGVVFTVSGFTTSNPSQINAGEYPNTITGSFVVRDSEGHDVTAQFDVTGNDGLLKINPLKVKVQIQENSGTFTYDGTEKTVTGYEVKSISSDLYTARDFTFSGEDVVKGTIVGEYDMELKAADFTNNNSNFDVTFEILDGKLIIEHFSGIIYVGIDDYEGEYDGQKHSAPVWASLTAPTAKAASKAIFKIAGYDVDVTSPETIKEVQLNDKGEVVTLPASIQVTVTDVAGNVVTDQMNIEGADATATLKVNPVEITLASGSANVPVEKAPAQNHTVTLVGSKTFVKGEGIDYKKLTNFGAQWTPGTSENKFEVPAEAYLEGTNPDNYKLTLKFGTLTVTANPDHLLTIHYVYEDGSQALPDYTGRFTEGDPYIVYSPAIEDYTPDIAFVRSGAAGMPDHDVVITVTYSKDPTDEPPGREIEDYDITVVDDDEVPLATGDHVDDILHFLLMAAALIVEGFYTNKRKKLQQKIFELKKQLGDTSMDEE